MSHWGAFLRIILPLAIPGMVAAFILSLVLCWNEYFFAALLTTGLLHLLLISAPSPWRFFGWIVGLAVAIVVIIPFTSDAELSAKVGTAAINLAVGIAIYSIVSGVGRTAAKARTF